MVIDIDEIIAYSECPMRYKFKYIDKISDKTITLDEKLNNDLHSAIYNFFSALQNNQKVALDTLTRKFSHSWLGNRTVNDIMYVEPMRYKDSLQERRRKGIEGLYNLYNYLSKTLGIPILFNKRYKMKITDNITLTGTFELVREIKGVIEMIFFIIDDNTSNKIYIDNNIKLTAAYFAFNSMFNSNVDICSIYGFNTNKAYNTTRDYNNLNMFIETIKSVSKCIQESLFYISPSAKCRDCVYKNICTNKISKTGMVMNNASIKRFTRKKDYSIQKYRKYK